MALVDHLDTLKAFGGKTPAEKLREALELYDDGVEMQRSSLLGGTQAGTPTRWKGS